MQHWQWWSRIGRERTANLVGVAVLIALGLTVSAIAADTGTSPPRYVDAASVGIAPYSQARTVDPLSQLGFRPRPTQPGATPAQPIGPGQMQLTGPMIQNNPVPVGSNRTTIAPSLMPAATESFSTNPPFTANQPSTTWPSQPTPMPSRPQMPEPTLEPVHRTSPAPPPEDNDDAAFTVLGDSPPREGSFTPFNTTGESSQKAQETTGSVPLNGPRTASAQSSDDAAYAFLGDGASFPPTRVEPAAATEKIEKKDVPTGPSVAGSSIPEDKSKKSSAASQEIKKIQLVVDDPAAKRQAALQREKKQVTQMVIRTPAAAPVQPSNPARPLTAAQRADLARRQFVSPHPLSTTPPPAPLAQSQRAQSQRAQSQRAQSQTPIQQQLVAPWRRPQPMVQEPILPVGPPPAAPGVRLAQATAPATDPKQLGPFEVVDHVDELGVILHRSKLLRTKVDIYRTAVVDPTICDVIQFTPREVSVIGRAQGATHVTFWFADGKHQPVTYLVRVAPDPEVQERKAKQYEVLEDILAELFPNSKVKLTPVADKLIVRGQARDAAEAAQILSIVRGERVTADGQFGRLVEGRAANPLGHEDTNRNPAAMNVINMLRIPGVQQVALRVKIAELNRSAARNFGVDVDMTAAFSGGTLLLQSLLNQAKGATGISAGTLIGKFDHDQLQTSIHYLESHGVIRMLSEPTLVTLSGRPASFVAGGEFAVPTTVGVGGASAVTTDFRAYGAIITFVPVVLDKDRIRLEVAPEFSKIDRTLTVGGDAQGNGGTPGLSTRAVTTTVEMREGQTLAIAGLLDDTMDGSNSGEIPLVAQILGKRSMSRNETELIILVTPELVEPMEPEEVPPLPGFDVTEPTNLEFYLKGRIEGRPTHEYRSTIWPRLRHRYQAGGPEMISGPFGHGD
ncbi:MAG: pilus assembly protein N-terminal domain-containing protein [Pirellulales bacterium]|nr:pilus assembly protein N-terminal domain-containing protein [Pirellulales bacterium]